MVAVIAITLLSSGTPPHGCLPPHDKQPWCDARLPAAERAALVVKALTVSELVGMMDGDAPSIDRLGIPAYHYGYEALHGMINPCPFPDRCFTSFPCSSASAASFNRSLWHKIGSAQIDEVRGMYNAQLPKTQGGNDPIQGLHIRGPQLNPQREPRWGRNDNSPGEDAYLEGQYGAYLIRGGQGADESGLYPLGERRKALCEMKHFDAYSVEDGRNGLTDDFNISLRDLSEYYFVPLKACIDLADVGAFMCSYNAINGSAACGNKWLNVNVTREAWNFSGVIESDCGAISGIQAHGNAGSNKEAALAAVRATVDVECDSAYKKNLVDAEGSGEAARSSFEASAARVLKGRFQVGQFDPHAPPAPWDALGADAVFSEAHQQLSLEAAQQSVVLIRNPSAAVSGAAHLPLMRGLRIAVIGPNGNEADVFQGQYHGSNCPNVSGWNGSYDCLPTAFSEIQRANAEQGGTTTFHNGCVLSPSASDGSGHPEGQPCASLVDMPSVLAAARAADVVLLFLGLDIKMTNKEGQDRSHNAAGYALPGKQQELARQLEAVGTPIAVCVLSGMATGMDYIAAQAKWPLLIGGYGGRFGPKAIAQIVFGDVSPTGRLPYTIYPEAWANNTAMTDMSLTGGDGRTYKYYRGTQPAPFTFGQGLTYTTFNTSVVKTGDGQGAGRFIVSVVNMGLVAAQQTVLLYSRAVDVKDAPQPLPTRQLFDFGKTRTLGPGQAHTLHFDVADADVALVDWAGSRKAFAGSYAIEFHTGEELQLVREAPQAFPYLVVATSTLETLPLPA